VGAEEDDEAVAEQGGEELIVGEVLARQATW